MQYIVINAESSTELAEQVNRKLSEGYELQGGVSVAYSRGNGVGIKIYAQAMIRKFATK